MKIKSAYVFIGVLTILLIISIAMFYKSRKAKNDVPSPQPANEMTYYYDAMQDYSKGKTLEESAKMIVNNHARLATLDEASDFVMKLTTPLPCVFTLATTKDSDGKDHIGYYHLTYDDDCKAVTTMNTKDYGPSANGKYGFFYVGPKAI